MPRSSRPWPICDFLKSIVAEPRQSRTVQSQMKPVAGIIRIAMQLYISTPRLLYSLSATALPLRCSNHSSKVTRRTQYPRLPTESLDCAEVFHSLSYNSIVGHKNSRAKRARWTKSRYWVRVNTSLASVAAALGRGETLSNPNLWETAFYSHFHSARLRLRQEHLFANEIRLANEEVQGILDSKLAVAHKGSWVTAIYIAR